MLYASFWPFDFSCSGFAFVACLMLLWCAWAAAAAARKAANAAKGALKSDTAKEVGRNVLEAWILSWFRK